jgi:hypothetical protein
VLNPSKERPKECGRPNTRVAFTNTVCDYAPCIAEIRGKPEQPYAVEANKRDPLDVPCTQPQSPMKPDIAKKTPLCDRRSISYTRGDTRRKINMGFSVKCLYYPARAHSGTDVAGDAERLGILGADNSEHSRCTVSQK